MLAEARAGAQNTVARAQAEADERLQRLQEELAARREEAETRMREIQAASEAVWKERHQLLDDIRRMARRARRSGQCGCDPRAASGLSRRE
jgi:DNA repair exonuclease SbcCD ATPase subunit